MDELRAACATVAEAARFVRIERGAIGPYARALPEPPPWRQAPLPGGADPETHLSTGPPELLAGFWLTLDAINFGSGWFPTLRKPHGRSGYATVAGALRRRFAEHGAWSAAQLSAMEPRELAAVLGQDPRHELIELFAGSLRDLGEHLAAEHSGRFLGVVASAAGSAVALARHLGGWRSFADCSVLDGVTLPFLKRAQIAAADLARAGVASFGDLRSLTMFADNLVPHVLRLDGVLRFEPELVARIDAEQLIEHDSREEVEIRACAVHAVELLVAHRPDWCAAELDSWLWERGRGARYKACPRHRSRCTAY